MSNSADIFTFQKALKNTHNFFALKIPTELTTPPDQVLSNFIANELYSQLSDDINNAINNIYFSCLTVNPKRYLIQYKQFYFIDPDNSYSIPHGVVYLPPEYQKQMDSIISHTKRMTYQIKIVSNYILNAISLGKNSLDHVALLPNEAKVFYYHAVKIATPKYIAHCWKTQPTLSQNKIDLFLKQNQGALNYLQARQLHSLIN